MNLKKKKSLASRVLNTGKGRIIFLQSRLEDIKEAITKQDIRDLKKDGAIIIRQIKGMKKNAKRRKKRGIGKIKKKVKRRKKEYVTMTRKLRKYVAEIKKQEKISKEDITELRKKIRNRLFRSKFHLKEHIRGLKK